MSHPNPSHWAPSERTSMKPPRLWLPLGIALVAAACTSENPNDARLSPLNVPNDGTIARIDEVLGSDVATLIQGRDSVDLAKCGNAICVSASALQPGATARAARTTIPSRASESVELVERRQWNDRSIRDAGNQACTWPQSGAGSPSTQTPFKTARLDIAPLSRERKIGFSSRHGRRTRSSAIA